MFSLSQVNSLLSSLYKETQRIPVDQPLACNCLNETGPVTSDLNQLALAISHNCIRGYTVQLNSILWAGLIPRGNSAPLFPPSVPCPSLSPDFVPVTNELTTFILENRMTFDPVDVVTYERGVHPGGSGPIRCFHANVSELVSYKPDGEFTVEFCTRGYCRGDPRSSWFLSEEGYPCISEREGVLCGQCRSGFALTTYSTVSPLSCALCLASYGVCMIMQTCWDCRHAIPAIPILMTVVLGLGFVVAVVALNFEASPTIDSLLFFTQVTSPQPSLPHLPLSLPLQAVYILLAGRANYQVFSYLAFFNPDFTFSLCVSSHLSALGRLGWQYATPLYILSLLLLILMLTRVKVRWISQYLGRHSFLKSLWFLILISYLNIALTTFELLHCRTIGSSGHGQRQILEHDASVTCYQNGHLAAAVFAILVAAFLILPFPLYTVILLHFPRFKPFTDAYTFMYRDWRRVWVAWSLFRRLLLVLLGVFITNYGFRHFSLLLGLIVILLVDVVTWPYRYYSDNLFSILVSWLLVVIAILTEPSVYLYADPLRGPSGVLVVGGIVGGVSLAVVERVLWRRGDSVDGVVGRLVRRWRRWRLEGGGVGRKKPASDGVTLTRTLPRYRESLLEQCAPEAAAGSQSEEMVEVKERDKEQRHWKRKDTPITVMSTSVGVAELDSGLASIQYTRHKPM